MIFYRYHNTFNQQNFYKKLRPKPNSFDNAVYSEFHAMLLETLILKEQLFYEQHFKKGSEDMMKTLIKIDLQKTGKATKSKEISVKISTNFSLKMHWQLNTLWN